VALPSLSKTITSSVILSNFFFLPSAFPLSSVFILESAVSSLTNSLLLLSVGAASTVISPNPSVLLITP
jgi:hypothetical protein